MREPKTVPRRSRRRETLTRETVLRAAVALVDREGLAALSMRRLGEDLGVEAMSLYRYVPGKSDLLDGIHETILAEVAVPGASRDWPKRARAYAHAFRDALAAHPEALVLFATRPAVTPASLHHVERGLRLFRDAGFGVADAVRAFQVLVTFVVGHTMAAHAPLGEGEGRIAWTTLDREAFPALTEAAVAIANRDPRKELDFGLDALLVGLAAELPRRGATKRPRPSSGVT